MEVVLRAAAIYLFLLSAVRLIGWRTASQLAPFDLVVLFIFGGIGITAIIGEDHSIVASLSAISTIGLLHVAVSWAKARLPWFGRLVDGTLVVIFEDGKWHQDRMRALRVLEADVMAAARQRGLMRLEQVRYAVAERDGKVSIIAQP